MSLQSTHILFSQPNKSFCWNKHNIILYTLSVLSILSATKHDDSSSKFFGVWMNGWFHSTIKIFPEFYLCSIKMHYSIKIQIKYGIMYYIVCNKFFPIKYRIYKIFQTHLSKRKTVYTKNWLVFWFDDKRSSLEVNAISWNSLSQKKKKSLISFYHYTVILHIMIANQSYSTVLYMDGMNIYSTTNKGEKGKGEYVRGIHYILLFILY